MAWRWLLPAHVSSMAITAITGVLELLQFSFNRYGFWIGGFLAFAVARRAGIDRHIRSQAAESTRARDIDVARGAFRNVPAFAAFVRELRRDAYRL